MTKNNKDGLPLLEYKIENMLDELIKNDEEIENNAIPSSLKLTEDLSSSEEGNGEEDLFEKDIFCNNSYPQNEERNQPKMINYYPNKIFEPIFSENNVNHPANKTINNAKIKLYI